MGNVEQRLIELAGEKRILRSRDLAKHGIPRMVLTRLERAGRLLRIARGMYSLPNADVSEHFALAEARKRVPRGVICLLSALQFHEMTTQVPVEVWMAIDPKARKPKVDYPRLRIVRFSGDSMDVGVREHEIDGVAVAVTTPSRTVADCFRYRNKVGIDIAVDALRDYLRRKKGSVADLWEVAEKRKVGRVIRPYIEALA